MLLTLHKKIWLRFEVHCFVGFNLRFSSWWVSRLLCDQFIFFFAGLHLKCNEDEDCISGATCKTPTNSSASSNIARTCECKEDFAEDDYECSSKYCHEFSRENMLYVDMYIFQHMEVQHNAGPFKTAFLKPLFKIQLPLQI